MAGFIPLEDIDDPIQREAYRKVVELYKLTLGPYRQLLDFYMRFKSKRNTQVNPADSFLGYFRKNGRFTEPQIKFISVNHSRVQWHIAANEAYEEEGRREELIDLFVEIADVMTTETPRDVGFVGDLGAKRTELEGGHPVYGRYFCGDEWLARVPETQREDFRTRLKKLNDDYFEKYHSA